MIAAEDAKWEGWTEKLLHSSQRRMLGDDVHGETEAAKHRGRLCCLSLPRAERFGSGTAISKYVQGMGVEGNLPISRAGQIATSSAFSTAGPKCSAANCGIFPFYCLPVLSCRAGSRPTPGTGVREITRFNYKASEMGKKKKSSPLSPLSPPQSCSACGGASGFMSPCESVNFFFLTLLLTETL